MELATAEQRRQYRAACPTFGLFALRVKWVQSCR